MKEYDLSKVFIYIEKEGNYIEISLEEMLEKELENDIFKWFLREISSSGIDLESGKVTDKTVQRMLHILETMKIPATLIMESTA